MRPWDRFESKHAIGNSPNTVVDVSEGRSPVLWDSTPVEIGNDLHRPSKLTEDLLVGQSRRCGSAMMVVKALTVLMRPGVHGDMTSGLGGRLHAFGTGGQSRRERDRAKKTHFPRMLPPIIKCVALSDMLFFARKSFRAGDEALGPSSKFNYIIRRVVG